MTEGRLTVVTEAVSLDLPPLPDLGGDVTHTATLSDGSLRCRLADAGSDTGELSGTPPVTFVGRLDIRVTSTGSTDSHVTPVALPVNGATRAPSSSYDPEDDYAGAALFEYTITDDQGATGTGTVRIDRAGDGTAASGGGRPLDAVEDTPLVIQPAELLGNDTDIDGDTLSITGVSAAVNGTVTFDGTVVTFTPDPNFDGQASFDYEVSDGRHGSDTGHRHRSCGQHEPRAHAGDRSADRRGGQHRPADPGRGDGQRYGPGTATALSLCGASTRT